MSRKSERNRSLDEILRVLPPLQRKLLENVFGKTDFEQLENYDEIIERRVNIAELKKKAKNNEYACDAEIMDDLNLMFDNCIKYWSSKEDLLYPSIAEYLKNKISKEYKKKQMFQSPFSKLPHYYTRYIEILSQKASEISTEANVIDLSTLGSNFDVPMMKILVDKLNKISNKDTYNDLVEILQIEPKPEEGQVFELAHCTDDKIQALREYVSRKQLEKKQEDATSKTETHV